MYRLEQSIPEDVRMNADAFTMTIINFGVGKMGLSTFYSPELDLAINERKDALDMQVKAGGKRVSLLRRPSQWNLKKTLSAPDGLGLKK